MGLQSVEEQFDIIEAKPEEYKIKDSKEAAKAVEETMSTEKLDLSFDNNSGEVLNEKPQEQAKESEEIELNFGYED